MIVAIPEGTARSRIVSPYLIAKAQRSRFSTLIGDVATTGNSGSGVFDATRKCLLGIVSRKFFRQMQADGKTVSIDVAKYFVPASMIRNFIPAEYRF